MAKEKFNRTGEEIVNLVLKSVDTQHKTNLIKVVKEQLGLGLRESKTIVDALPKVVMEKIKGKDAVQLQKIFEEAGAVVEITVVQEANAPVVEEPSVVYPNASSNDSRITCDLILKSIGTKKSTVVILVKKHCGLNLEDSTRLVESTPCVIKTNMSSEEAENMKKEFEAAGAEVEIGYVEICAPVSSIVEEEPDFGYDVILKSYEKGTKTKVVEAVRESTGFTKVASQAMVDQLPSKICQGVSKAKADEVKASLEKAGGVVETRPADINENDEQGPKYNLVVIRPSTVQDNVIAQKLAELNNRNVVDFQVFARCESLMVFRGMGGDRANAWKEAFEKVGAEVAIYDDQNNHVYRAQTYYDYTVTSLGNHKEDVLIAYMKNGHSRKEAEDNFKTVPCCFGGIDVQESGLSVLNKEAASLKQAGASVWMAKNELKWLTWFEASEEDWGDLSGIYGDLQR